MIKLKQVAPTGDTHVWFGRQEHAPDRIEVFVGLEDGPLKLQRFPKAVWVHSNGTEELDRMKTIACEHGYEETEETSLPKNKVNPSDIEPSAPDFLSVVVNAWF